MNKIKNTTANYGLMSWLYQRITAVLMLLLGGALLVLLVVIANTTNFTIDSWQSIMHCKWVRGILQIFVLSMLIHAWIGIRDLWMDYIKCMSVKIMLYTVTVLWLFASLIYSIMVIWQ